MLLLYSQAESLQMETRDKFEKLSEVGKQELTEFKGRRVTAFRKNLIELGELEVKHSKVSVEFGGIFCQLLYQVWPAHDCLSCWYLQLNELALDKTNCPLPIINNRISNRAWFSPHLWAYMSAVRP